MFSIQKIPDKGLGLVATETIQAGDPVIIEKPLVTVALTPQGDLEGNTNLASGVFQCRYLDQVLRKKSDAELGQFFQLTDMFTPNGSKSNFGIIKTNSFSVSHGDNTSLMLFPTIARINHSCAPNCHHYWSRKHDSFVIRAVKTIASRDEISISYMSPLQRSDFHDKQSRQEILRDEFGFDCRCQLCQMSPHNDNDAKRRRILDIERLWNGLGKNPETALEMGEEQFQLCQELNIQPGLMSYVGLHCIEAVSLLVAQRSDDDQTQDLRALATDYARQAQSHGRLAYGEDSDEYEIFQAVLETCQKSSNSDLLVDIQQAITSLRDIDA